MQKGILYYLLRNVDCLSKLQQELDAAQLSFPPSYAETKDLPYLNAVIKEGMRMHPPVGNILERVVPDGPGLTLPDGRTLAPGTIVGMNQWIISRNKDVFGEDVDSFRPERWLRAPDGESQEEYEARLGRMKEADFSFGGGNRVCTGRHLAVCELLKVTATLVARYDVSCRLLNWAVIFPAYMRLGTDFFSDI